MLRNVVFLACAGSALAQPSPIRKVITLIEEMKANVEKEGKDDMKAYDEYKCWCDSNGAEKKEAIEYATEQIADLESFIEEAGGKEGELKTEIAGLESDIADDNSALANAASVRDKEQGKFEESEADSKETIGLLTEAIAVLNKAQTLAQTGKANPQTEAALIQVHELVQKRFPKFQGVMQKDLYDMMSTFRDVVGEEQKQARVAVATGAFLGEVFLPKREAAVLEQSEEQSAQKQPSGQAAGSKSYNSRGGQIIGLLSEMKDEMVRDLTAAQKAEFKALVDFQSLRAAKLAEIEAANTQKKMKEAALADLLDRAAKAAENLEAMKAAKSADEKFVTEMTANCKVVDDQFAVRSKIRGEEVVALAEVIGILTSDDARDLFAKSVGTSFLQESSSVQDRRAERAMQHIVKVAKKHKNWVLLSLAVRVRLDGFTKVIATMDKMLAQLKKQQADEYEKHEQCKKDIDTTEDNIKISERKKKDLAEKHKDLSNTIETLSEQIETLKTEVSDMEVSLKKAGIDRKSENEIYQQQVADQRATVKILNMALERMKEFYQPSLVQVRQHQPVPGAAVEAPPSQNAMKYEKSGGAGGVTQLLTKVIEEATAEEQELEVDENSAQKMYGEFVLATKSSLEADRSSIAEKEKQVAETESEKSMTEEAQLANKANIEDLNGLLTGFHADCDYVIKYFKLRQQARQEEMDSIEEAKAILSGADFGK